MVTGTMVETNEDDERDDDDEKGEYLFTVLNLYFPYSITLFFEIIKIILISFPIWYE